MHKLHSLTLITNKNKQIEHNTHAINVFKNVSQKQLSIILMCCQCAPNTRKLKKTITVKKKKRKNTNDSNIKHISQTDKKKRKENMSQESHQKKDYDPSLVRLELLIFEM